jgi:hypothetical protein
MADSISEGIGERLAKQETRVSLRATAPDDFMVESTGPGDLYTTVPLTVGGVTGARAPDPDYSGGNHATGITMEGNTAIIVTPGLYTIIGQCSVFAYGGYAPHSFDFYGTVNYEVIGLPGYGLTNTESYTGSYISDTRQLAAGDQIRLMVGVGTDHIGGFRVQDAMLSITLHYAT